MKTRAIAIVSTLCWLGVAVPNAADAQYGHDNDGYYEGGAYADVDFDVDVSIDLVGFFRPGLAAYGRWSRYGGYGEVWCPTGVGGGWRPYRDGHWVLTDAGWAWVSDEPWGSGPYHYGRWFHADAGWCWVPGREWAPSWVSWRHGSGVIGWAPLPPSAGWQGSGVREVWIEPHYYNFVEERHFVEPRVRNHYVPFQRVERDWARMRDVTHYERSGRRINVRPFQAAEVERFVGRSVRRQRVVDVQRAVPNQLKNRAARRDRDFRDAEARRDRVEREQVNRERERAERERVDRERAGAERRERVERHQHERRQEAEQAHEQRRQQERAVQQERPRQPEERARRQTEERQQRVQRDQMQQQRRRQEAEQARKQQRPQERAAQQDRARQNDERAHRQADERRERASDRVDEQRVRHQQREERRTGARD